MSLPYDYYPAVLYAIGEISQGRTVTDACDRANISLRVFESYLSRDPDLKAEYDDAIQRSYDAMADALVNIDNHKIHGQSDSKMAKVISDNIKWVLSKRDSKRFGERIEVKHSVSLDRAITDALNAARFRVNPELIEDAQVIEETDDEIMRQLLG